MSWSIVPSQSCWVWRASQFVGRTGAEVLKLLPGSAEIRPALAQLVAGEQEIIKTRQPMIVRDIRVVDATGRERWIDAFRTPLMDAHGAVRYILGVGTDQTQQRRRDSELATSGRAVAERSLPSKSRRKRWRVGYRARSFAGSPSPMLTGWSTSAMESSASPGSAAPLCWMIRSASGDLRQRMLKRGFDARCGALRCRPASSGGGVTYSSCSVR